METPGGNIAKKYTPYSPTPFANQPHVPGSPETQGESDKKPGFVHTLVEWVKVIVIALIIALPIRFFIAEPFIVNGASMDPTFATGQFLIVDRLSYHFEKPERGDVIVFAYPGDPSVYYIKRIIGLPGETVSMKDGNVTIKNVGATASSSGSTLTLDEPYIASDHASHDTIIEPALGPDQYFVMGDNRAQSSDSRVWGPLDYYLIIGRPVVRLTPLDQISFLPGENHENNK